VGTTGQYLHVHGSTMHADHGACQSLSKRFLRSRSRLLVSVVTVVLDNIFNQSAVGSKGYYYFLPLVHVIPREFKN